MKKACIFLLFIVCSLAARGQYINTVAGGGTGGLGDGGPAVDGKLLDPYGIVIDAHGNIYIADRGHNRIRMVSVAGIITTIAGNDTMGYSGDGGPSTAAKLNFPMGIALDKTGNIYFSDDHNDCVRKINTVGIITTIAGKGTPGYSGDGASATAAEFDAPVGLKVDGSGNIYVADGNNNCIRKINTDGIISTIAGTTTIGHTGDGGPATAAELYSPYGISLDGSGNIYFTEFYNNCVRKIDASGIISTVAGNNTAGYNGDSIAATAAELKNPTDVIIDEVGNVIICDGYNQRIRSVNRAGIITTIAGTGLYLYNGDGELATIANIGGSSVALDANGSLYISDFVNDRIRYVRNTVSIPELTNAGADFTIYPNPCKGSFDLNINSNFKGIIPIEITDEYGRKIKQFTAINTEVIQVQINVPDGIYFITSIIDGLTVSKEIVVQQ